MSIPDDPYFAGRVEDKAGPSKGERPASVKRPPVLAWTVVYIVNLFLPVFLGLSATREGGKFGMLLGVILYFTLGCYLCYVAREVVRTLVYGGWVVAVAQCFLFPHMIVGLFGVSSAGALGQAADLDVTSEPGGFIATLVTGGILLAAAAVFGLVIRWIMSGRRA